LYHRAFNISNAFFVEREGDDAAWLVSGYQWLNCRVIQ